MEKGALCVFVKDTLSIHSRDPEVINEMHDSLTFRISGVAVSNLHIKIPTKKYNVHKQERCKAMIQQNYL